MKLLLTIAITLLSLTSLNAQSTSKTFHLKNGSVVTGVVIEEVPGEQYKVRSSDGNIFVFSAEEIDRIVLNEEAPKDKTSFEKGYNFYSQNGFIAGGMITEDYSSYNLALQSINGVNINNRLQVGLGLELQIVEKGSYIPIYLDAQLNFSPTPNTLFTHMSMGVALSNTNENLTLVNIENGELFEKNISYESGFLGRIGFGYRMEVSKKLNALIDLNYSAISYESNTYLYSDQYLNIKGIYSIIGVRLGVEF